MGKICTKCGAKNKNHTLFCSMCGQELPREQPKTVKKQKAGFTVGSVLAMLLSLALLLVVLMPVFQGMIETGINFGKYNEDQIPTDLFDFFDALAGKKTAYEKEVQQLQKTGFWVMLAVCIPCGILLYFASKKAFNVGLMAGGGVMGGIMLVSTMLVLQLYNFDGSPKIAIAVVFFLAVLLSVLLVITASRHIGFYALALVAIMLAAGFGIGIYVAQIIGVAAVVLDELFWIVLFLLCGLGGTSSGGATVYIFFI